MALFQRPLTWCIWLLIFFRVNGLSAGTADSDFVHEFEGTLGSERYIKILLQRAGNDLRGYYVTGQQTIIVKGTIDKKSSVILSQYVNQTQTGTFEGKLTKGLTFTGVWYSDPTANRIPFSLNVTPATYRINTNAIERVVDCKAYKLNIKAFYPQLAGMARGDVQFNVNSAIYGFVRKVLEVFERNCRYSADSSGQNQYVKLRGPYREIRLHYHFYCYTRAVASFSLEWSEDFGGPLDDFAHYSSTFTYDLDQNKPLSLTELFDPKTPFIPRLIETMGQNTKDQYTFDNTTNRIDADYFKEFYLLRHAIVIRAGMYRPDPYSLFGENDIVVPYTNLSGVLKKNGPIDRLRKD